MVLKRLTSFGAAFLLSVSSLFVLAPDAFAAPPDSVSWDRGAGTTAYNTANNWNPNEVPSSVDHDHLTFPNEGIPGSGADLYDVDFNVAAISIGNVIFSGAGNKGYNLKGTHGFKLNGNITVSTTNTSVVHVIETPMALEAGDHTVTVPSNTTLYIISNLTGSGKLIKAGAGTLILAGESGAMSGNIEVSAGTLVASGSDALGDADHGTTVKNGASLLLDALCEPATTFAEPLTLQGASSAPSGDMPTAKLTTIAVCGSGSSSNEVFGANADNSKTVTLSGTITADTTDVTVASRNKTVVTKAIAGGHSLTLIPGYSGQWVIGGETKTPALLNKTLSDPEPGKTIGISDGAEVTVTGKRGAVVLQGGVLKGTGEVGAVSMSGGTIAPGMSPGILTTGNLVFTGGTHEVEIGGTEAGQFDQLNVTGTVALGSNTTLSTLLVSDFKPAKGNSFVIINNDDTDAVTGTFAGLAEGATFTLDGYVFKITYVGGTGNDVVLTVENVPGAPNTGVNLMLNNPFMVVSVIIVAAAGVSLLGWRYRRLAIKS